METRIVKAYGAASATGFIQEMEIPRRALLPNDVEIEILYCGICHSDLHAIKDDWGITQYPIVPGHEIVGRVSGIGTQVSKFKVGDLAAVGCIVDSCRQCEYCAQGEEQYCAEGWTIVFDSHDKHLGGRTYGGFSQSIVVDADYVLIIPEGMDPAACAPLLCAGITMYSPLKRWKAGPGKKIGVIGIGGLGHLAIRIAKAMGAQVVAFSTSASKIEDAREMGADEAVLSTDPEQMKAQAKFDLILDTISGKHDVNPYLDALKVNGSLILLGLPAEPLEIGAFHLTDGRKSLCGSSIGGIADTQETLYFCAEHDISADIELIKVSEINEALERLERGEVKYRFVIDMKGGEGAL